MSNTLLRRNSLCLPFTTSETTVNTSPFSIVSPSAAPPPMSRTPLSSTTYVRGRGSFTERKPPHVVLPITPTPPPLPPPPPNPQLAPLKPRSRSQQWPSSKSFGVSGFEKLPVRSHSVKAATPKRSTHGQPPPRPLSRPKMREERTAQSHTSAHSSSSPSTTVSTASTPSTSSLRQEVFRASIYAFHSSLLFASYLAWTSFIILLLPAFCISYCIRQIGLLLAQHRRSGLVETLSSLSLHYLHGEDAGRNTVVVIYLGSPGIKIAALKRLLVQRILSKESLSRGEPKARVTRGMERWFTERLQQTVVQLPTGYAWERCTSVDIDEHVVPAYLVGSNRPGYGRRLSPKKRPPEEEGMVEVEKDPVELLVGQLTAVGLPLNRPLWQVHLVEDYHDNKDALTVRRIESPFSPTSWQEKDFLAPWRNSRPKRTPADTLSVTSADRMNGCRRNSPGSSVCGSSLSVAGSMGAGRHGIGPIPTGSLIVFRVHSAITDDAQSLVEFLTILLSEGTFEEAKGSSLNCVEPGTLGKVDDIESNRRPSTSSIFKVRISESSLEREAHPEKPPPSNNSHGANNMRTYLSCFCAWFRELNALRREVMRALLLGPFLMLHNLMMVPADLGLLPSLVRPNPSEFETPTALIQNQVFRRIQLPLDKLLHVQKITRASFSEIAMSLLAGALRAYQETSGLKTPPDLLIRASTSTPNFELCCERLLQMGRHGKAAEGENEGHESDHHEALTALNEIANGPPAHCIFAPMQLPLSEEGMIPRLWRVHQRILTLQRTAVAVTLAWTRNILHLLLPHWIALRADSLLLGGASKCSVIFTAVSLEGTGSVDTSTNSMLGKRSKPGGRKWLKSRHHQRRGCLSCQNSQKMDVSQALRLVNRPSSPPTSSLYDGSPSEERNLDLLYLSGGVPIVRIEAWLANHREATTLEKPSVSHTSLSVAENGGVEASMCRDLAVVTCVYGSNLTVGLTACKQMDGEPGIDFILNTMLKQLNNLYNLLDSRFPAKPLIYAPRRRLHLALGSSPPNTRIQIIQSPPESQNWLQIIPHSSPPRVQPTSLQESPGSDVVDEELVKEEGHFLKFGFPPLSSDLKRSSPHRIQKSHTNTPSTAEETGDMTAGISKLVPILKASVTAKFENEIQTKCQRTNENCDNKKTKSKMIHSKKGHRRFILARKFKKRPAKPPPPTPRKSQVRFLTEEN